MSGGSGDEDEGCGNPYTARRLWQPGAKFIAAALAFGER
jgi:hypothetical protein